MLKKIILAGGFSCWLFAIKCPGQSTALSPVEIQKLVPTRIMNFNRDGEIKGKLMKVGDLHYSLCEHRFRNKGSQTVRVLLFDFKEARIMYDQATRDWVNYAAIKNDSIVRGPVAITNCMGWESYNREKNFSQISLGISDRFLLMITGENVDLEMLKVILGQFRFENFPK